MKKLLMLLACSALSLSAFSYGLSYGVKAGWNYSNIRSSSLNTEARQGFHAGLYGNFKLPILAIQPEILYSQKGYKVAGGSDIRMDYIDIPVMLKFSILPVLSIDAGPQFSYLIKTQDLADGITLPAVPTFNTSQFDGAVGVSAKIWRVGASARYIFGLQELESLNKSKNSLLQLSLQFKL